MMLSNILIHYNFDHQKGAHNSFSLILLPLQKPVKESSHHAVMAALPEPPTLRAVSLTLHHTPISLSPSLSVSVIGFCLYFPTSIYHRSLSAISPSI